MGAYLGWIDTDSRARDRALRILALFSENATRDELGLGAVRDSIADHLFPGVNIIQTRLRYMLFVPWIYQKIEARTPPPRDAGRAAGCLERDLIAPLLRREDNAGVFGKRTGRAIKRLPSNVYWSCLGTWGIRLVDLSQEEYHRRLPSLAAARRRARQSRPPGEGGLDQRFATWHPGLPSPPPDFPGQAKLALRRQEAEFLQGRIQASCPGSLLAELTLECREADCAVPWEHPRQDGFSARNRALLHHARLFALSLHGAAVCYNLQLARLAGNDDLAAGYEERLAAWSGSELPLLEVRSWDLDAFWEIIQHPAHAITPHAKSFITAWVGLLRHSPENLGDNTAALDLVRHREMYIKGERSRFRSQRALDLWKGNSGIAVMNFRWTTVRTFLRDMAQGLARSG